MVKEVVEMKIVCPEEEDSGMEDLLKQLEAEGWTEIEEREQEGKKEELSPLEETRMLLRKDYDTTVVEKIGARPGSISYEQLEQKTREFSRLQSSLDRRMYLEETLVIKGVKYLFNGLERIAKRPVIIVSPTEEIFERYFEVGEELKQLLDQAHEHYQECMEGVKNYKDGRVLKLFVESMDKKRYVEAEMQGRNKTFAKTAEQLSSITKSHPHFPKLYIARNNLRRELKGLANEFKKTCQRIVIKNEEMYIMSEYEEELGNAVAIFDREREYLADIMEHAEETQNIYEFSKELKTGVTSVHNSAKSLSHMVYTFVGRILQSSEEIARVEYEMENERLMPKISERLSKKRGINLWGPKSYTLNFVSEAEKIVNSAGIT